MKTLSKKDEMAAGDELGRVVAETRQHAGEALAAMRKGCEHALLAGLRLIWLHRETNAQGQRNDLLTRDSKFGFKSACEEIGIQERTAYRWMNATGNACLRATLIFEGDDLQAGMPAPGTPRFESWEKSLKEIAQGMSLNRLMLGRPKNGTDTGRMDELLCGEEEGRTRAIELLEAVDTGKYTLAQAVKALGSQEAYDRLRADGGEKIRKDPVYLSVDGRTGDIGGLVPRALKTLKNAWEKWDETPEPARKAVRRLWLEVVTTMPADLID